MSTAITGSRNPIDRCSGLRKSYAAILKGCASNNLVAALLSGLPFYYSLSVGIYQSVGAHSYLTAIFGSSVWIFMSILLIAWLLAGFAIWKTLPNLLSVSVFVYTAMGHWCLISGLIVMFYVSSQVPLNVTGYLLTAMLPSIALLLLSGDILRGVRGRLYGEVERAAAAAAALSSSTVEVPTASTTSTTSTV